ncbi:MAG: SpoIIE family protein phosphatase [bacterium]|nr:SpoIIE family protein phosphatase [bacterium]
MQVTKKLSAPLIIIFFILINISNELYCRELIHTLPENVFSLHSHLRSDTYNANKNYSSESIIVYRELKNNLNKLSKAKQNNDIKNMGSALLNIGCLYAEMGNYKNGLKYFQKLKQYGLKHHNKKMLYLSYIYSGEIYEIEGRVVISLENYFKSLKFSPDKSYNVLTYSLIGKIYITLKNFDQALFYVKTAEEIAEKTNDNYLKFIAKYYLSQIYLNQNKYKESIETLSNALSSYSPSSNCILYARSFTYLGEACYHLHKYDRALLLFKKALDKSQNENETVIFSLCYTGYVYTKQHAYTKAYEYLAKAERINNITAQNVNYSMIINKGFSNLFFAKKEYKKAYKYRQMYERVKNKVDNQKLISSAAILSNKYINTQIPMLKENILAKNKKLSTAYTYNILLIIISSLIFIMLILLFYLYYGKKKHAAKLNHLNNSLDKRVKERTTKLKYEIKERNKLEYEIKTAAEIQKSILPEISENFIRPEFTLYAALLSAVDAAGDFYDFYYIDDNTLALIIADVAGKGISAAFYMTFAKTVLWNCCQTEKDPAKALTKANKILATNNVQFMFVTVFLCFYNIKTGDITYANAGHHDAVIFNTDSNKNYGKLHTLTKHFSNISSASSYHTFGYLNNLPLGFSEESIYDTGHKKLAIGESIFCYTDGVTEAMSPSGEGFGEEKLYKLLLNNQFLSTKKLAKKVITEVESFEKENRFDDITVLVFRRNK